MQKIFKFAYAFVPFSVVAIKVGDGYYMREYRVFGFLVCERAMHQTEVLALKQIVNLS